MSSLPNDITVCHLHPGQVDLAMLRTIYSAEKRTDKLQPWTVRVELADDARAGVLASQETVNRIVESGKVVYGINTGFGKLAQTRIPAERLAELQRTWCCRTVSAWAKSWRITLSA